MLKMGSVDPMEKRDEWRRNQSDSGNVHTFSKNHHKFSENSHNFSENPNYFCDNSDSFCEKADQNPPSRAGTQYPPPLDEALISIAAAAQLTKIFLNTQQPCESRLEPVSSHQLLNGLVMKAAQLVAEHADGLRSMDYTAYKEIIRTSPGKFTFCEESLILHAKNIYNWAAESCAVFPELKTKWRDYLLTSLQESDRPWNTSDKYREEIRNRKLYLKNELDKSKAQMEILDENFQVALRTGSQLREDLLALSGKCYATEGKIHEALLFAREAVGAFEVPHQEVPGYAELGDLLRDQQAIVFERIWVHLREFSEGPKSGKDGGEKKETNNSRDDERQYIVQTCNANHELIFNQNHFTHIYGLIKPRLPTDIKSDPANAYATSLFYSDGQQKKAEKTFFEKIDQPTQTKPGPQNLSEISTLMVDYHALDQFLS